MSSSESGFRTHLYYISTSHPSINIERVQGRVKKGGHSVPEDKIISRYSRSMDLLFSAIKYTNRAFIFDNSTHKNIWLAEITNGRELDLKIEEPPLWFNLAVYNKFLQSSFND